MPVASETTTVAVTCFEDVDISTTVGETVIAETVGPDVSACANTMAGTLATHKKITNNRVNLAKRGVCMAEEW